MDFKSYPNYKDSGVEWIGNIPSHWSVKRFGYIFRENKIKNSGLIETNVLSLSYGCIKEKNIEDNKVYYLNLLKLIKLFSLMTLFFVLQTCKMISEV